MKIIAEYLFTKYGQTEMYNDSKVYLISNNDYNLILEKIKEVKIDDDFDFGNFLKENGIDYDEVNVEDFINLGSIIND